MLKKNTLSVLINYIGLTVSKKSEVKILIHGLSVKQCSLILRCSLTHWFASLVSFAIDAVFADLPLLCGVIHHASIKTYVLSDSTVRDAPQFDAELCQTQHSCQCSHSQSEQVSELPLPSNCWLNDIFWLVCVSQQERSACLASFQVSISNNGLKWSLRWRTGPFTESVNNLQGP